MNQIKEFSRISIHSDFVSRLSAGSAAAGGNKAGKVVYNKFQCDQFGQQLISEGVVLPAGLLELMSSHRYPVLENGRPMLSLTGGKMTGVSGGISKNVLIHSCWLTPFHPNKRMQLVKTAHKRVTLIKKYPFVRLINTGRSDNLSSTHSSFRLAGEPPDISTCDARGYMNAFSRIISKG